MAKAKVAQRITRIADAAADQVTADGAATDGRTRRTRTSRPSTWRPSGCRGSSSRACTTTIRAARWAPSTVPMPTGRRSTGPSSWPSTWPTSGPRESSSRSRWASTVAARSPLQAGGASDTRGGVERFSLSGTFSNGAESSGTTDISGRLPGEPIEYYNAGSGVFGFYDDRASPLLRGHARDRRDQGRDRDPADDDRRAARSSTGSSCRTAAISCPSTTRPGASIAAVRRAAGLSVARDVLGRLGRRRARGSGRHASSATRPGRTRPCRPTRRPRSWAPSTPSARPSR